MRKVRVFFAPAGAGQVLPVRIWLFLGRVNWTMTGLLSLP
jgi:hypothetical protein